MYNLDSNLFVEKDTKYLLYLPSDMQFKVALGVSQHFFNEHEYWNIIPYK